jgi:hypothetical protein
MNKRIMVCDASNMLHRTFFAHVNQEPDTLIGMVYHTTFMSLNKYYKKVGPHQIVMAFDRSNWRKAYTESEACYSKRIYKGHRKDAMAPKIKALYSQFQNFMVDFEQLVREHSSIVCLGEDGLEADDLIGGMAERAHKDGDQVVIISGDKDMIQLLRYNKGRFSNDQPTVKIIDPATGNAREHEDPEYFIFEKCIRGDTGDNVHSAFPRVRVTKIREAYLDAFKRVNMMNETWTNEDGETMLVKRMFDENKLLMDLTAQPREIRQKIFETIENEMDSPGKYSHFHFLRFLGKYELKTLASQLTTFIPLLSLKPE